MSSWHQNIVSSAIVMLVVLAGSLADRAPLFAGPASDSDSAAEADDRAPHGALSVGFLTGFTGPLGFGAAAEAEFFPGGRLGHHGVALSYRSDLAGERGMVTGGLGFVAGATRPKLVMSLQLEAGAGFGPAQLAAGAGVRAQLGVFGPLVIAARGTAHFLALGGPDTRLVLAATFTAGFSR